MDTASINFISPAAGIEQVVNAGVDRNQQSDFIGILRQQIASLNSDLEVSDTKLRELATGGTANLHDVMISLEKAKLSMELLLQVRNKALEAYQELMRTQL